MTDPRIEHVLSRFTGVQRIGDIIIASADCPLPDCLSNRAVDSGVPASPSGAVTIGYDEDRNALTAWCFHFCWPHEILAAVGLTEDALQLETVASRGCEVCGASLEGRRPQTRTCSPQCRLRLHRSRAAA